MVLGLLLGNAAVFVKLLYPLIAAVSQAARRFRELHAASLEQLEIVNLPRSKRRRQDRVAFGIEDQLRL